MVLSHILSSYLANLSSAIFAKDMHQTQPENIRLIRKSIAILNDSDRKLGGKGVECAINTTTALPEKKELNADETLLKEQLGFVNKISNDIARVTDEILN